MNAFGSGKLGVRGLATKFKLALLAIMGTFSAGGRSFMTTVSTDAYRVKKENLHN